MLVEGLAAWRLARMAVKEAGPFEVFTDLRYKSGIEYDNEGDPVSWPVWNPLHCVLCSSLYTAVLVKLMPRWMRRVLAASAVAVLVEDLNMSMRVNLKDMDSG